MTPTTKPHTYGLMRYCTRCGMAAEAALGGRRHTCQYPDNVRSLANELAWEAWVFKGMGSKHVGGGKRA